MAFFGGNDTDGVNVHVSSDADTKGIDRTTSSVNTLEAATGNSAKSAAIFGAVAGAAAKGVDILTGAVRSAASAAVSGTAAFEQNRVAFDVMLGGADKARVMMLDISKFAKETPFELPEVVQASKQLLAFGIAQQEIIPTMRQLGDIAAGVGVPVSQLAYVFGQVRVAGRLMGGDLLQFTNAGVPMIEGLSKVLKVSQADVKKMVEQGKVGFTDVAKVLDNMTKEGSQFGGMMEKQSHTFNGVVSNIKDGFGQVLRSAMGMDAAGDIVKGGLFDKMKDGAAATMPVVQKLAEQAGPMMGKVMSNTGKVIGVFVESLRKIGDVVGPILGPQLQALWDVISNKLWPAFQGLLPMIGEFATTFGVVLGGALVVGINLLTGLLNILAVLAQWIGDNKDVTMPLIVAFGALWAIMKARDAYLAFTGMMAVIQTTTIPGTIASLGTLNTALAGFMGWGIFAAAAIGAFVLIMNKYNETVGVLDEANRRINASTESQIAAIKQLGDLKKNGTPDQKKRATDALNRIQGFATGVRNFSGGLAVVGEEGPEIVNLPRGADVYNNTETKQMMGGASSTYNIQNVNLTTAESTNEFFKLQDRNGVLASRGITPVRPGVA